MNTTVSLALCYPGHQFCRVSLQPPDSAVNSDRIQLVVVLVVPLMDSLSRFLEVADAALQALEIDSEHYTLVVVADSVVTLLAVALQDSSSFVGH